MSVTLFDIKYYNTDTSAEETLRISSGKYITTPSDTPANTRYDDRVLEGGSIERHMFGKGRTTGESELAFGRLVVSNIDGALDYLEGYGFDLRAMEVRIVENGDTLPAIPDATFIMEGAEFSWGSVAFILRDPMLLLDLPANPQKYAGTNSGSSDVEGDSNLEGKSKPFVIGKVRGVSPPLANSTSLIFVCNYDSDGTPAAVNSITNVRLDYNSAAVTLDTTVGTSGDAASLSALASATIASGKYATCLAAGAIRFNNLTTNNVVTFDVEEGANAAARTVAQCVKRIVTERTDLSASDFNAASITALDSAQSSEFGIYNDSDQTVRDLVFQLLEGAGAYIIGNEEGKFELGRLEAPTGSVAKTYRESDIVTESNFGIESIKSSEAKGLPIYKAVTNGQKIYRTFRENEFAGAVAIADREYALQEFRSVTAEDSSVLTTHKGSDILEFFSLMDSLANLATENTRQLTLRKVLRRHWRIRVKEDELLNLGDIVQVNSDRFGFGGGKKFVVIGYKWSFFNNYKDYFIWG